MDKLVTISVSVLVFEDEYNELSLIARSNGWTLQGLLGPMLREGEKRILLDQGNNWQEEERL